MSTIIAVILLGGVLGFAVLRPFGLPEAVLAVPAAALVVATGLAPWHAAWDETREMGPTVGFLAAILLLAFLADRHGVFTWAGRVTAHASGGHPRRLLLAVFGVAAVTTAALSLDATVVLLTPVVLAAATRIRASPTPHVYACTHLANSASLLLPVSNLTNLLAFAASGLTFLTFAGVMLLPWLAVIAVEYAMFRLFFATDLPAAPPPPPVSPLSSAPTSPSAPLSSAESPSAPLSSSASLSSAASSSAPLSSSASPSAPLSASPSSPVAEVLGSSSAVVVSAPADASPRPPTSDAPRFAITVLAATLAGFAVAQPFGLEPAWVAVAGALTLAVPLLRTKRIRPRALLTAANPAFCAFVLALGVVVLAVRRHGGDDLVGALAPQHPTLVGLLAAALAAALANLVNNLPATLMLLPAVHHSPPLLLAVLIGVNVGPNLTYAGSLATLLWRRVLHERNAPPRARDLLRLGALTVPVAVPAGVVALWLALHVAHV